MRKLKLQVQMTVDGFIAGLQGEMDWLIWDWDDAIKSYVRDLTEPVDTIILGRKLAEGFIPTWTAMLEKPETADQFARKMVDTPKVVFTKTMNQSPWANTELATGELVQDLGKLKQTSGKDIIAYGGVTFVSALIQAQLIDEFHLFINPAALGQGMTIFKTLDHRQNLTLVKSQSFACGIVVLNYVQRQAV